MPLSQQWCSQSTATASTPPLCPRDDPSSLPVFSNGTTSMLFPALRSPNVVFFLVPACFLAVVLIPVGQTHVSLLSLGAPGCPELTAKPKYQSGLFAESNPGKASCRNVQREEIVTSSAGLGPGQPASRAGVKICNTEINSDTWHCCAPPFFQDMPSL